MNLKIYLNMFSTEGQYGFRIQSANLIRQIISLTFLVMSLSGLGLACCTFSQFLELVISVIQFCSVFVINQTSKNREIESFFRRFGLANTRFERRRHHFHVEDEIPLPTKLQPFEKHRRSDNILSFFDVKRMY